MEQGTCTWPEGCDAIVFIRKWQLCRAHYMRARKQGLTATGSDFHRISDPNPEGWRGTCSICGPDTPIRLHSDGITHVCLNLHSSYTASDGNQRKHLYGLDADTVKAMFVLARWRCEICSDGVTLTTGHIDHDHACCPGRKTCGKCVRGILCARCNSLLTRERDNPALLRAAVRYLERAYHVPGSLTP